MVQCRLSQPVFLHLFHKRCDQKCSFHLHSMRITFRSCIPMKGRSTNSPQQSMYKICKKKKKIMFMHNAININTIPKNSFSEMETCRKAMITSLQINLPLKLLIDKQCIPAFTLCQHFKAVCFPVPVSSFVYIFSNL